MNNRGTPAALAAIIMIGLFSTSIGWIIVEFVKSLVR